MRAGFLESDNAALKEELLSVKYVKIQILFLDFSDKFWFFNFREELQTLKEKMLVVQMQSAAAGKRLPQ